MHEETSCHSPIAVWISGCPSSHCRQGEVICIDIGAYCYFNRLRNIHLLQTEGCRGIAEATHTYPVLLWSFFVCHTVIKSSHSWEKKRKNFTGTASENNPLHSLHPRDQNQPHLGASKHLLPSAHVHAGFILHNLTMQWKWEDPPKKPEWAYLKPPLNII